MRHFSCYALLTISSSTLLKLRRYGFHARETHAAKINYIGKPISQYTLYSAMFCLLHSNIGKGYHEKHLCNPSSLYGKYGEYTREKRTQYLNTYSLYFLLWLDGLQRYFSCCSLLLLLCNSWNKAEYEANLPISVQIINSWGAFQLFFLAKPYTKLNN